MPSNGSALSGTRRLTPHCLNASDSQQATTADRPQASACPLQRLVRWRALQQCGELVDGETRLANEGPQRAFRERLVLGNNQAAVRRVTMAEHDVAAPLAISLVADALERADGVTSRDARELAQTATSTSSS